MIFFKSDNCLILQQSTATQLSTTWTDVCSDIIDEVGKNLDKWMNGTSVSSISIDLSIQLISIKSDLPDISILIFIDLVLRANWQQKTTLHVQHTFLPLFCTTTTWNFLVSRFMEKPWMSYVGTKDFFACVMAQSILSVPIPRAFVRHLSFCFGKAANNAPRWRGPGVHTKTPQWGLKTKQKRKLKRPTQIAPSRS